MIVVRAVQQVTFSNQKQLAHVLLSDMYVCCAGDNWSVEEGNAEEWQQQLPH